MPLPQDKPRSKLLSIQYVRAAAALVVVGWHSGYSYTVLGQAGVDLFFVVSGFVMMLVSGRESSPLRFAAARVARIVPLYWLLTASVAVLDRPEPGALLSSFLFWPDRPFPVVIQGWSLDLEMSYYVLFALALLGKLQTRLPVLAAEILLVCAAAPLLARLGPAPAALSSPLALEFLAGACLFPVWQRHWLPRGAACWVLAVAAAATLAATHPRGGAPEGLLRVLLWGGPATLLVAAGLGIEQAGQLPRLPGAEALGDASYALYLTHVLALRAVDGVLRPLWAPAALALALLWCCAVGWLVHQGLERPLNRGAAAALRRLWPPVRA